MAGSASATLAGSTVTLTGTPGVVTVKATQTGNGGSIGAALPVYQSFVVQTAPGFVQLSSSKANDFTLGIRSDGTLWAWGINSNGQLGDTTSSSRRTPVQVGSATNWSSVSCGTSHVVALRSDGTMYAWGLNSSGQVGQNSTLTTTYSTPTRIGTASTWSISGQTLSAGGDFTFAIDTLGKLWAWGLNTSNQLGDGTITTRSSLIQIGTDADWNFIFDANNCTYAIKTNGTLWAWGANGLSQLGDGTTTQRNFPIQIGTDTNWRMVAGSASSSTSFAAGLKTDGSLFTWGSNSNGQLGNGTTTVVRPTQVGVATDWATLAAGNTHVLALKTNHTLWAWGLNSNAQLGDGTLTQRTSPLQIGTATNWASIAAGTAHSLATTSDGSLYAWGSNAVGQLGNGTVTTNFSPARIGTGTLWSTLPVQAFATHSLIFAIDRTLWTAGQNASGQSAFAGRNLWVPTLAVPGLNSPQSLTFTAPSSVAAGNTITLSTTTTSALPSSYIVTGPATLVGDQLTVNSAGTVCVIAYQPGDSAWQSSDISHALINATAPDVTTLAATSVGTTTATLNAIVNPDGTTSTAQFQFGTTTSYGTNVAFALNGDHDVVPQNMTTTLTGLTPGTTYHFQAAATSSLGTTNGDDLVFTTLSTNADLASLSFAGGTLTPAFAPATTSYASEVSNATSSITLTPVVAEAHASFTVNGAASTPLPLTVGTNPLAILVTAQDGVTTKTYTLTVTRRTPYQDWVLTTGIANGSSGALQDSDGDGIPNLLEWAFGINPTQRSSGILSVTGGALSKRGTPGFLTSGPNHLAVFGRRMDYLAVGLVYTVEFSANLTFWQTSTDTPAPIGNDGEIEAVTVPYPAQINGQDARFFRVKVITQ